MRITVGNRIEIPRYGFHPGKKALFVGELLGTWTKLHVVSIIRYAMVEDSYGG